MAVISTTAAKVRPLTGAIIRRFTAGGALTVGQAVYVAADGDVEAADADDVAQCQARGIVVGVGTEGKTTAAAGDVVDVVTHGPIETGASGLTDGAVVYVSPTAGAMDQTASATSGDFNYIIGFAMSDTIIYVHPQMVIPTAVT